MGSAEEMGGEQLSPLEATEPTNLTLPAWNWDSVSDKERLCLNSGKWKCVNSCLTSLGLWGKDSALQSDIMVEIQGMDMPILILVPLWIQATDFLFHPQQIQSAVNPGAEMSGVGWRPPNCSVAGFWSVWKRTERLSFFSNSEESRWHTLQIAATLWRLRNHLWTKIRGENVCMHAKA